MTPPLGPPMPVSPLIRFGRWSLLITGLLYGASHHKYLAKREVAIQAEEHRLKAIRDANLAAQRKAINDAEMKMFEEIAAGGKKA